MTTQNNMIESLAKTRTFDPELTPGAHNAVNTCLNLQQHERITLITDEECREIAASFVAEIEQVGSDYAVFVMEEYAQRPLKDMPRAILDDLATSQVSIFAARAQPGELASRIQMTSVVNKHRIRHGHAVNITGQVMKEGMRADFLAVDRLSQRLLERARRVRQIHVTSPGGTDIVADFAPHLKWIKTSGLITAEKWGNLPGGEIFTAPHDVNGVFVVDGVVGDYLCEKYGDLIKTPITIEITGNRISRLACTNRELLEDFKAYTSTDENSNRVGEFAIGTNLALTNVIGNILQDEKLPGVHIAFGHPYAEHTGQTWISTTHIDCVARKCSIRMDGEMIMDEGAFLITS